MAKEPLSAEEISRHLTSEEIKRRMSFYIHEVGDGHKTARDLSLQEVEDAFRLIFEGKCSDAQTATFLVALRIKGSSDDERYGLMNILRGYNQQARIQFADLVDYSGFYDGRDGELHLSPAIGLVSAAAGARVVLTGGKSRNNNTLHRITLQEVLRELGVRINATLEEAGATLSQLRIAFVDTHFCNKALNNPNLDRIREDIGLRTPINTVEVSLNPANAPYHIRGMFHPRSKEQVAHIMARSGIKRGLMLTGIGGSGEIPTYKSSEGYEILEGRVKPFTVDPAELGFSAGKRAHFFSPDAKDQGEKNLAILEGRAEPTLQEATLLNAGLILYLSEKAATLKQGVDQAKKAYESGEALKLFGAWRKA